MSAMEIFLKKNLYRYPNISIAYRILYTMPVVSAERTFSKLIIEEYLRFIISEERLNGLATLRIEKNY